MLKKCIEYTKLYLDNHSKQVGILMITVSLLALVGSSLYIGQKSALIHTSNADSIIDGYMFEGMETFQESIFPGTHSFLLKWPVFAISAFFGNTESTYVITTILLYLATVCGFLFVIYRLTNKDLHITALAGFILTCTLLLVPPQPLPGALLPLNMAMVTTRNIEFLFLFGFIYLILKSKKIASVQFIAATAIITLLGASDRYYLMIVLLAAAMYAVYTGVATRSPRSWKKVNFLPLIAGVVGYITSSLVLKAINMFGITTIDSASKASPFSIVASVWDVFEATAGAIQGVIANYGANIFGKDLGISLLPYLLNGLFLCACAVAVYILMRKKPSSRKSISYLFTLWLILTFIGSLIIFVASNHTYLTDGRYLTGSLFAGVAALAFVLKDTKLKGKYTYIMAINCTIILLIPVYLLAARSLYASSFSSTQNLIKNRVDATAKILTDNNVDVFVGDYWFTPPVRLKTDNKVLIAPMTTDYCDSPNYFLTSNAWYRPNPSVKVSALYVLKDGTENTNTFNHGCTMQHLNEKYGEPSKEFVIRKDNEGPVDIIRIYNYDIREKMHQ